MIYDKDKNSLSVCYDKNKIPHSVAYGKYGNEVFSTDFFTVMSYNVQHFTGINKQEEMQRQIISTYNPDIIGFQEFSQSDSVPAVAQNVLYRYQYGVNLYGNKTRMAIGQKDYPLSNVVNVEFTTQDPNDMEKYGETRAYMTADITVGEKTIKIINTHLCLTNEYKYLQMAELLEYASQCEYFIMTGDFNAYAYDSTSDDEYTQMWKIWHDGGYHCANHQADGSYISTYTSSATAESLADFRSGTDDIITSSNIDIVKTDYDTIKLSYLNGDAIDHIAVISTLVIN